MKGEPFLLFSLFLVVERRESGELWVNGGSFIERKGRSIKETKTESRQS